MKLEDFADIISGYTFRGAIKGISNGNTIVVQAKDIQNNIPIIGRDGFLKTDLDYEKQNALLEKLDVLITVRVSGSNQFRSTVFNFPKENFIASSSLYILRVKDTSKINPFYISVFLNSKKGQEILNKVSLGSNIMALTKNALQEIKIPIPSFEEQNTIWKLVENMREQEEVNQRKFDLYKNITNYYFISKI